jgi:hypothetical protein
VVFLTVNAAAPSAGSSQLGAGAPTDTVSLQKIERAFYFSGATDEADAHSRFTHLISPTATIAVQAEGVLCVLVLHIAAGRRPVPPQRYDYSTVLLRGIHWVTGRDVKPIALHHPGPAPIDPARWEQAFRCPVHFGATSCRIELSLEDLALPIPTADPAVAGLCERIATQIAEQHGGSVSLRVRRALTTHLPKGDPRREAMAATLCMSERTLQRRLTEEGTSFAELVDDVRRELAQRYFAGRIHVHRDDVRARLLGPEQLLPRMQALVRPLAGHDAGNRALIARRRPPPCSMPSC